MLKEQVSRVGTRVGLSGFGWFLSQAVGWLVGCYQAGLILEIIYHRHFGPRVWIVGFYFFLTWPALK